MGTRYCCAFALLFFWLSNPACAEGVWDLQVNGVSYHADRDQGFNENNNGLGVQYSVEGGRTIRRYLAGTLINSMNDRSWYAGGALAYRVIRAPLHFDVGLFGGAITYPSSPENTIAALLPMATIGTDRVGLNVVYIPHIAEKTHAAVLLQLTIRLP